MPIEKAIKKVDKDAYMIVLGHVGDGNLHVNAKYSPPADKHEEMKKLIYSITGDFGGSISAEHGIGIAKRPYLKLSRTAEEIETMRTLKRALDPHHILNPGRIFDDVRPRCRARRSIFNARSSSSSRSWPQKISPDGST